MLALPPDSPEWYRYLGLPICEQFEPRHLRVLNHPPSTTGEIRDPSDNYLLAQYYRGKVLGLKDWDGPSENKTQSLVFLVKHPYVDLAAGNRRGLGETNALIIHDRYAFAAITFPDHVYVGRPVLKLFQQTLFNKFNGSLSKVDLNRVPVYQGVF